jgi:hypothetical protein
MCKIWQYLMVFVLSLVSVFVSAIDVHAVSNLVMLSSAAYAGPHLDEDCDYGEGVAIDRDGNVIVAGYSHRGLDYDWFTAKYDQNLVVISSVIYTGSDNKVKAHAVAIDHANNIIVTGIDTDYSYNNSYITIKYDSHLAMVSSTSLAGTSLVPYSVAIDGSDNIIVTGSSSDGFLTVKYSPNLVMTASATFASPDHQNGIARGVAVDASDNIMVTGYTSNGLNTDIFTIKYSPAFVLLASATYDSSFRDRGHGVAVDRCGNIIVAGCVNTSSDQDSGNIFTIKYSPSLAVLASAMFAGDANIYDEARGVATDSSNNIIVTGSVDDYGPDAYNADVLTVQYNPNLVLIATAVYNGSTIASDDGDAGCGVAVDASDNMVVFGFTNSGVHGYSDGLILKYESGAVYTSTNSIITSLGGSVQIRPESGLIGVAIPPNAFTQNVSMAVATVTVPSSTQDSINVTPIGIEITTNVGLQPQAALTLTVHYRDADIAGHDENKLTLARYDNGRWIPISTTVYADQNKLVATVTHLSIFAVVEQVPAVNLAQIKAYPNPYNPRNGTLTLANLTVNAEIKIFTITGELVRILEYSSGTGQVLWDGKNDGGAMVASGVYLALIKNDAGKKILKIAVER